MLSCSSNGSNGRGVVVLAVIVVMLVVVIHSIVVVLHNFICELI